MVVPVLVVVGCPSRDKVNIAGRQRRLLGGAAFLTALAARRAGVSVGLAARVPAQLPSPLAQAFGEEGLDPAGLLRDERGLPSFEIAYDDEGRATYREFSTGGEASLRANDLPSAWLGARTVHISPIAGSTALQLRYLEDLRQRGFQGQLSAGPFLRAAHGEPAQVRALAGQVDLFFCNREEAERLWSAGRPDCQATVCVTDGARPLRVWQQGRCRQRLVPPAPALDPTGAGDAFCGGYLAGRLMGSDACARGLAQARYALSGWGAAPFLQRRARTDAGRIAQLGPLIAAAARASALDFCGFPLPERGDPLAAETLAAATLHQYGFWNADERRWLGSMWARAAGRRWKGSDFVWQGFTRAAAADPSVVSPTRMAQEPELLERILSDEDGRCPLPELESHRQLHQAWGAALPPGGFTQLLQRARGAELPGQALLDLLACLPGYAEDPLQKKASLLVLILSRRPDGLLSLSDPQSLGPIVDYHMMRACLRTGCVRVLDPGLRARLAAREWVYAVEEDEIREASWHAIHGLCQASERSVGEVDGFLFSLGRSTCLEAQAPRCQDCPLAPGCARCIELFQPVFRTTAY